MVDSDELTMKVLKKIDPMIHKRVFTSTFCSLYEYDQATANWLALNYEGSLYLLERKIPSPEGYALPPGYRLILLNRKNRDNLIEDLTPGMQFVRKEQYVYYKKVADENLLSTH